MSNLIMKRIRIDQLNVKLENLPSPDDIVKGLIFK